MTADDTTKFSLDVNFLLLPSLEEMQDSSRDDLYAGPLTAFAETTEALENECRDKIHRWGDIVIRRAPTEDLTVAGAYPSDVVMSMAAWLGSAAGISLLYKLLKTWSTLRKGRKIVIKLPRGLHIEATQLSERQFVRLIVGLQECGVLVGTSIKGSDRTTFVLPEKEKAFEVFLTELTTSGLESFDEANMRQIRDTLYRAYIHSLDQIRDAPDFQERSDRAMAKYEKSDAKQRMVYLSDMQPDTRNSNTEDKPLKRKSATSRAKRKKENAGQ